MGFKGWSSLMPWILEKLWQALPAPGKFGIGGPSKREKWSAVFSPIMSRKVYAQISEELLRRQKIDAVYQKIIAPWRKSLVSLSFSELGNVPLSIGFREEHSQKVQPTLPRSTSVLFWKSASLLRIQRPVAANKEALATSYIFLKRKFDLH